VNTSQRNIVRIGCYVLAGLALFAGWNVGEVGFLIGAFVLALLGKFVWAGRAKTPEP
jgi:hypothetical protein